MNLPADGLADPDTIALARELLDDGEGMNPDDGPVADHDVGTRTFQVEWFSADGRPCFDLHVAHASTIRESAVCVSYDQPLRVWASTQRDATYLVGTVSDPAVASVELLSPEGTPTGTPAGAC